MQLPKVEIRKILYATDLSESARFAFAYAVSLAEHYRAGLTILHVLHDTPDYVESLIGVDKMQEIKRRHLDEAREALIGKRRDNVVIREYLDKFAQDVRQEHNLNNATTDDILIREGKPVDRILETAEAANCDIIVMGTHGVSGFTDAVIGSTARRVLRRSRIPVFAIPLPDDA